MRTSSVDPPSPSLSEHKMSWPGVAAQLILARLVHEGYVQPNKLKSMLTFFEGLC